MTAPTPAILALDNSHLSYEIAQKIQGNPKKTFCIIHENNAQTQQLFTETQLFLPPEERARALWLPDWETLPYDQINAHRNIISHRIQTLYRLTQTTAPILFVSLQALCYRLPPRSFILQECLLCEVGKKLSVQDFRSLMLAKGYHETPTVQDIGQFSIRGSILDVILTDKKAGSYRIELFDDEIDSIRKLDITTNRSHSPIPAIQIQPHQEFNRLGKKHLSKYQHIKIAQQL